ncbi:hypothetical protein [Janibacter hoylei]|uniref:hypothetical protein n=1 Tax=Janibacter hoylei TaxID=364298 RepID=UPI0021A6FDBC|nr:hypothetical protein [Janibacter hoylei]MCT1620415.1 hypothetical protein [Janibacter hoylei]MCT2293126.1 hypothetical protein [Janibacter hoylei]
MRVVIMAAVAGVTLLVAAVVIVAGGSGGSETTSTGTSDRDGMVSSTDASKAAGAAEGEPVDGIRVSVE